MIGINYLYYGALFCLLLVTTTASVLTKQPELSSKIFFWLYAIGQAVFEIAFLCLAGEIIRRKLGAKWFWIFAGFTFWVFIWHSLDFLMDRILDLSFLQTIGFVLDESFENFLFLLDASGVPYWVWGAIFLFLGLIPLLGAGIYWTLDYLSQKKPWILSKDALWQFLFCVPIALLYWDFIGSNAIDPDSYNTFTTSLPWKRTFRMPESVVYQTAHPMASPPSESSVRAALEQAHIQPLAKKPNIYLIIVESLRHDFINEKTAPNLTKFQNENTSSNLSISNGNGTMMSWFSIFHSEYPLYWSARERQGWDLGSASLAALKKMGYKIHVFTSAQLGFYGMEKLLFGKDRYLLDSFHPFYHVKNKPAWRSDLETVEAVEQSISQEGNLVIVFWDATHFDYSWPKDKISPFIPFARELAYFKAFQTKQNQEEIRNRYRNAVFYMDSLFGKFLQSAPADSLIAFMGDHGEEFFDHGHLFHNSHLTQEQISVPIYLKLGNQGPRKISLLTQMDVMPTLLDAVSHRTYPFLKGDSILRPKQIDSILTTRFNASRTPVEFALQNQTYKAILRFDGKPFETTRLQLVSLREKGDLPLARCPDKCDDWLTEQFGPLLKRLFEN